MTRQTKSSLNLYHFSGKRQRNSDLVDRISNLPDCILSAILSLLPTKQAVSTILLSKRWKFLWRTVDNLDFYHSRPRRNHEDKDIKFIEFVNGVLNHHDGRIVLNKFSIYWKHSDRISSSLANSWIKTAIIKNVRNISLNSFDWYDLPTSAFSSCSLRSLTLSSRFIYVSETLDVCLPRLESLNLGNVEFESEEACERLIHGCPMLSKLYLRIVNDDFECIISSASLRRLTLYFSNKSSLNLNASSVEYLSLNGAISEIFVEKSLSSLVEADLNLDLDDDDDDLFYSMVKALCAFDCAKVLTLSIDAVMAFECAASSKTAEFKRLEKLVTTTCILLPDFIRYTDNLQVLEIEQEDLNEWCYLHLKWEKVPRCLSKSLKKVKLYYYESDGVDYELIRFILEHGSVLEAVEIYCDDELLELAQNIFEFPRKSPVCVVSFSKW